MPILVSLSTFRLTHILLCSASARVKRSVLTQSWMRSGDENASLSCMMGSVP